MKQLLIFRCAHPGMEVSRNVEQEMKKTDMNDFGEVKQGGIHNLEPLGNRSEGLDNRYCNLPMLSKKRN